MEPNPYAYEGSLDEPATPSRPAFWALAVMFGVMYFVQGVAEPTAGLISQPVQSMFRSWEFSASSIGLIMFFVALPWSIKPLFGLLADFVPFLGTRQKGYLVLCNVVAILCLLVLYLAPWKRGSAWLLCAMLVLPTAAIAFTDVLIDVIMIQKGQAYGLTGTYQGIQWGAIYTAAILTGWLGGWLSEHGLQEFGFLICAGVTVPALFLSVFFVREDDLSGPRPSFRQALMDLKSTAKLPALWAVAAFIFLWNFNPFSTSVQQYHMTEELKFGEQFYGFTLSLAGVASLVASVLYAVYCRFVPRTVLIHASIVLGVVSTLGYWWLTDKTSAVIITLATGFTYMTALLIQLDLAAQTCPPRTAGTVFATLMAVSNLSFSLSTAAGGVLYDLFDKWWDRPTAFNILVWIGAAFTACCWLLTPLLRK